MKLQNTTEIYRGCNKSEIDTAIFGQSWTTSVNRAEQFAYEHYADEDWFRKENRVILKAEINREDIYYSNQKHYEREIVVNPSKLFNIELYKKHEDISDEK